MTGGERIYRSPLGEEGTPGPVHLVVMGVSGCGKTTLALALQKRLGWPYAEADDFHPKANVEKMSSGRPLTDEDRWPWLRSLRDWMSRQSEKGMSTIVACSALKRSYRDVLRQARGRVLFVELDAPREVLRRRMATRLANGEHFMPVSLLDSQLATLQPLEPDETGLRLEAQEDPDGLARRAEEWVHRSVA